MFDEDVPYVNSQVADENPAARSPSLFDLGGGGWSDAANNLLDKGLAFALAKDRQDSQQTLDQHASTVAPGAVLAVQSNPTKVIVIVAVLLGLGVGAVWLARRA